MTKCTIEERGNGFPDVGGYAQSSNGNLYRVDSIDSRIQTEQYKSNYVHATVTQVDWDDCGEEEQSDAQVYFR
jgi:hypothetical protein